MAAISGLIFLAHVYSVFGTEPAPTCSVQGTSDASIDGFQLLKLGGIFRLARTTFQSLSSNTFRCIIAKTTKKDQSLHQVTELVRYMVSQSFTSTYTFTQNFQFTCESGRYNKMTSIDNSTVPHASYRFLRADPSCTVLEYLMSQVDQEGEDGVETVGENGQGTKEKEKEKAQPQSRDSSADDAKKRPRDCMLWVEGIDGEPSEECEQSFNQLCGSIARYSFNKLGCDVLFNAVKHEDSSSAENLEATKQKSQGESRSHS
uniref:Lipocalin/cytosolic fatty-acid binding domain-containing protein n=1 Tax=Amblyomma maculatum TaxID=34609 RepID=G3MKY8_AMBMU